MKKQTKILVLILSLALMLGSVVGITAIAAEEGGAVAVEQPKIVSKSVYYGDQVYLYYAINNSALTEEQELELLLYVEDPTVNTEATAYKATLSDREYTPNPAYPVFKTFGIPAKAIGDTIYAVPHIVGTDVTYDNMETYSVAEYCWEMLYTTKPTESAEKLYNSLLEYGISAQEYFGYNTDKYLLSNLAYVYVDGGTIDGTNASGIYDITANSVITPTIAGMLNYNVTVYNDGVATTSKVSAGTEIDVTGHTVISSADIVKTVNDRRAESDTPINVMTLDFTLKYTTAQMGADINKIELLDENGNAIKSLVVYCQNYGEDYRFRIYDREDGVGYLSGANVGNTLGASIQVRITYNWTTGEMHVYTNGNDVSYTFETRATDKAIKSLRFSDLVNADYTIDITRFDIQ